MLFTDLGLKAEILRAIAEQGYTEPTPIQQQAIPAVLAGRDLMACAQTGTGKTAGFTLPILQLLSQAQAGESPLNRLARKPRVLILAPTRELALQVEESVRTYGQHLPLKSMSMFGGVGMNPQIAALKRGVDILVACPGRLLDHINQRTLDLSGIEILVLDEADRMLDMGFIRDIRKILALLPPNGKRQNLLFSATFSDEIKELARSFLHDPQSIEVARRNTTVETVSQKVIHVDREKKKDVLLHLFENRGWNQVLIFTRTKHGADALSRRLDKEGIRSAALHGNKTQGARVRALTEFKEGKLVALVATDIAARGIDIDQLPYVVNYELPNVAEDYVHRIGRTGRAGAEGEAISLVCHDERDNLRSIERLIKKDLEKEVLPGFEPSANPTPAPPQNRGGQRQGQGQRQGPRQGQGQPGRSFGNNGGGNRSGGNGGSGGRGQGGEGRSRSGGGAASGNGGTPRSGGNHRNGTRHH
ncbi:DEAD/DEAH box helicase [Azospira sp. I09]|uniref:DEAD/DEAH box helicase n=1 Tax=Azospira sp. I09 TaxID=1765049 RepID=UPI0012607245|nr:DEAD/DEAH box helicase [Azospira sp. I09]BBN87156.1 ATP-dependent RNA helicase RhlE [Azospira sp. I09]